MNGLWALDAKSWELALAVLIKLGIGAVLAGLIGWERERGGRAAGIRTHILMIFGVILFSEVSKAFVGADPSRIAAQILTGIGFLGAGTIMRVGPEIKGLTTAASIWSVSAIGMAISVGGAFLIVAVVATALTLLTMGFLSTIEHRFFPNAHPNELLVTLREKSDVVAIINALNQAGIHISETRVLRTEPTIDLLLRVGGHQAEVLSVAAGLPGVLNAGWS